MDKSILGMAEEILQREVTQDEMDRLSAAYTIAEAREVCADIIREQGGISA